MIYDIAIIDYKMGNLHSVQAACNKAGLSSKITSNPTQILDAKASILPGVGAFGDAMRQISELKLDDAIFNFIDTGKPFIGVCLGMQLLFESSEEFGEYKGLGIIKGSVKKFKFSNIKHTKYPVPQIGWNQIHKVGKSWDTSLLSSNQHNDFMYFVHSYYVKPENKNIILSETLYGNKKYCSSIKFKNIFASQFHPEKSGKIGLKIYEKIRSNLNK
jgi:imidazole glycerol-phosphate synthase subunit HisH